MSLEKLPEVKRTPNELIAKYSLEPNLNDLYLEGPLDKVIFELFLDRQDLTNVMIYDISVVDFSASYLENPELFSNREKLISLSGLLHENFDPMTLKVRCVIDKDFNELLDIIHDNEFLLISDFSSIEGYLIEKSIINKILRIAFQNFPIKAEFVIEQILNVGKELFLLRCARIVMNLNHVQLLDIDSACTINKNGLVSFKCEEYVNKICQKNVCIKNESRSIIEIINELREKINGDLRNYINGHDFIELFFKYVKVIKNTNGFKEETFEKTVQVAIEVGDLIKYSLFNKISNIYSLN